MIATIFAVAVPVNVFAQPTEVWVDDDFDASTPGWGVDHFDKIQDGVNAIETGGSVFVYDGTYYEEVTIPKTLTLEGEDKETTIIDGTGSDGGWSEGILSHDVSGITIQNLKIQGFYYGIYLDQSDGSTISGNTVTGNDYGIYLYNSDTNTISGNTVSGADLTGIGVDSSSNAILTGNVMTGCGITMEGSLLSHWNTHTIDDTTNTVNGKPVYYWKNVDGGTIPSDAGEVILANSKNIVVENLDVSIGSVGVILGFSPDNTIRGNNAGGNGAVGIVLYMSGGTTVTGNIASGAEMGISVAGSEGCTISGNTATSTGLLGYAIRIRGSRGCTISNNTAMAYSFSYAGIEVRGPGNTITGNTAHGHFEGIFVQSGSGGNTITGNTATARGRAIYILYTGGGNTITGNTATAGDVGIQLASTGGGDTITGNTAYGGGYAGILLIDTDGGTIAGNTASSPRYEGIYLWRSSYNTVEDNTAMGGRYGIRLDASSGNTIECNTVTGGIYDIFISASNDNIIFHNNFIDSEYGVADASTNTWDNDAGEGNYWIGYTGSDDGSGGRVAGDGIGDTDLPHQGVDWYPLMSPWSPDPVDAIGKLKAYVEALDIPNGIENSLISQLNAAENALSNGQEKAAVNILNAFIHHVEALRDAGKLTQEQAEYMISSAQKIIEMIES